MAKKPRPSITDQLAAIAATRSDNVSTSPRDDVTTLQPDDGLRAQVPRENTARDHLTEPERGSVPEGYKRRVRYEKPHASIYAHPKVFKALREIAAAQDCKPHDLYLEGLRLVLRQHGRDFDALNRGDG